MCQHPPSIPNGGYLCSNKGKLGVLGVTVLVVVVLRLELQFSRSLEFEPLNPKPRVT